MLKDMHSMHLLHEFPRILLPALCIGSFYLYSHLTVSQCVDILPDWLKFWLVYNLLKLCYDTSSYCLYKSPTDNSFLMKSVATTVWEKTSVVCPFIVKLQTSLLLPFFMSLVQGGQWSNLQPRVLHSQYLATELLRRLKPKTKHYGARKGSKFCFWCTPVKMQ